MCSTGASRSPGQGYLDNLDLSSVYLDPVVGIFSMDSLEGTLMVAKDVDLSTQLEKKLRAICANDTIFWE